MFLTVAVWFPALGQGSLNPFDLVPRLPASERAAASAAPGWETGNPFDVAHAVAPVDPQALRLAPQPEKKRKAVLPPLSTEEQYKAFLFTVLVGLLALLTILVTMFRQVYQRAYRGFLNENMLNQIHRESQGSGPLPYFILYGFFLLNAGTFVFLVTRHFGAVLPGGLWQGWLMCAGGVSLLLIAKHLLLAFLGAVFPVGKEVASYNFTIVVFGTLLGLLLVPANVFIAYGPAEFTRPAVFTTFGVIGLVYAFRSLRGLFIANNFLASNKFHFFLYLCIVEITPVLVLVKLIQNQV